MAAAAATAPSNGLTVLITGVSRGIGLGLVETYAKKGWRVIAAARDPPKAALLQALIKAHPKSISTVVLDVSDSKSTAALYAALTDGKTVTPKVEALDMVINNAGIQNGFGPLETATAASFLEVYRTNVVGPFEVAQAVLPLLRAVKSGGAKLVNVSSSMGSVATTNSGWIPGLGVAYRASKSALNQVSAVQAREWNAKAVTAADAKAKAEAPPLVTVVSLDPGWVDTELGSANGTLKPPLTVQQSVTGIEQALSQVKPTATAIYLDYTGKILEW